MKESLYNVPEINELLKDANSPFLSVFTNDRKQLLEFANIIERTIEDEPPVTIKEGGVVLAVNLIIKETSFLMAKMG